MQTEARLTRDSDSRQRVIDAAVACILDQGFYRASSNAIADRAGVTWGVIQYHFGSREALMLAVLEDGAQRLTDTLSKAEITGGTVTERVGQYGDILASHYTAPEYLAFVQVLLNLTHDPRTTPQTRERMNRIADTATPELHRLQRQVLAGAGVRRPSVRAVLLHALRGLALSHVMLEREPDQPGEPQRFSEQRDLLAEAIGLLVEHEGGRGKQNSGTGKDGAVALDSAAALDGALALDGAAGDGAAVHGGASR
jgi:AcrR family transcriptional regulator